ncbi:uncharacterized protein LOC142175190 [Nicotiana tabacum]|uniref:Uncharacterized protein LOC142175190 n=1 Tax=Nicotiana tabacum TaxID=4097 RepID=A0AC58TKZ6_TOBAC
MAAPPDAQEGQSIVRAPLFNEKYYGWWKERMCDFLEGENLELWDIVEKGPKIPILFDDKGVPTGPKPREKYSEEVVKGIQKNAKAKKILICAIGPDEYNKISACRDAKAIWDVQQFAHEGTSQVKQLKIDVLTRQYKLFKIKDGKTILEMHTRLTAIINELISLGEVISRNQNMRKTLSILPSSRDNKKAIRKGGFLKKGSSSKPKNVEKNNNNNSDDGCYKCGKKDQFINDCPLWELEWKKNNFDKEKQQNKDGVPRRRMTNKEMDKIMKKKMAAIQSSSIDKTDDDDVSEDEDQSLMAKEHSDSESEYILALMGNSDSDADEEEEPEQLISEYASLRLEHKDLEISRENLDVIVVDLKDQILVLEDEKAVLETENNRLLSAPNKGNELATNIQKKLESELKETNNKLLAESEKARILQENLDKAKFELEKNLFIWNIFLASKDETFDMFVTFVKKLQRKMNNHVVSIRSDRGTKFENANFLEFCNKNGIDHNFSAPKTPQQNSIVGKNKTLEDMARTMLISSGIPKTFWAEAVNNAYYIINRCMIRTIIEKNPYELLKGRKSNVTHLRTFRSKCFVHNNGKEALGKFDAKSDECIFLGYSPQSKVYKVYNKITKCVKESIHVIFDESNLLDEKGTQVVDDGEFGPAENHEE